MTRGELRADVEDGGHHQRVVDEVHPAVFEPRHQRACGIAVLHTGGLIAEAASSIGRSGLRCGRLGGGGRGWWNRGVGVESVEECPEALLTGLSVRLGDGGRVVERRLVLIGVHPADGLEPVLSPLLEHPQRLLDRQLLSLVLSVLVHLGCASPSFALCVEQLPFHRLLQPRSELHLLLPVHLPAARAPAALLISRQLDGVRQVERLHGKSIAWAEDVLTLEVVGEEGGVDGGRHQHEAEVGAAREEIAHEGEEEVRVALALVTFVHDQHSRAGQGGVGGEATKEDAHGTEEDARGGRGDLLQADLIADGAADVFAALYGDALGEADG